MARVKAGMFEVVERALSGVSKKDQAVLMQALQTVVTNLGYGEE
jgi:hypothetical protein